jgi:hypothetical protein
MSTMTPDREEQQQENPHAILKDIDQGAMLKCTRCKLNYLPAKSTSALRLTYCSFLCELGDLGFSIAGLEHMQLKKKDLPEAAATVAVE